MGCISCSELGSYPDYLNRVIKEIEAGDDNKLKSCLCRLKTPVNLEVNPITYEENGKTVTTLFPFCVKSVETKNEILSNGGIPNAQYVPFSAKALMDFYWLYKDMRLDSIYTVTEYGTSTYYYDDCPKTCAGIARNIVKDTNKNSVNGPLCFFDSVEAIDTIKGLICSDFPNGECINPPYYNGDKSYSFPLAKFTAENFPGFPCDPATEGFPFCNNKCGSCPDNINGGCGTTTCGSMVYDEAVWGYNWESANFKLLFGENIFYVQNEDKFYIYVYIGTFFGGYTIRTQGDSNIGSAKLIIGDETINIKLWKPVGVLGNNSKSNLSLTAINERDYS